MRWIRIVWDETNERKIAANDVAKEEVEEVLLDLGGRTRWVISRRSRREAGIAWTSTGRRIVVPFDDIDEDSVRPVTAYEHEEP